MNNKVNIPAPKINVVKGVILGKVYNVITEEQYFLDPEESLIGEKAVSIKDGDDTYLLPVKSGTGNNKTPGYYKDGDLTFKVFPTDDEREKYKVEKLINFSDSNNLKEVLKKEEEITKLKEPWITSPDNITTVSIQDDDSAELVALKEAINKKEIDIDKYADRFGANYPNYKRQLKGNSITLKSLKIFCNNLDIDAKLILSDKGNPPNPMNDIVEVNLTDIFDEKDE